MIEPVTFALMNAKKLGKVLMFWYRMFIVTLLTYKVFEYDGHGYHQPIASPTFGDVVNFFISGSALTFILYWTILQVIFRYLINIPIWIVGNVVVIYFRRSLLEFLAYMEMITINPIEATISRGDRGGSVLDILLDKKERDRAMVILGAINVMTTCTLIVVVWYDITSPIMNVIRGVIIGYWIYQLVNHIGIVMIDRIVNEYRDCLTLAHNPQFTT